MYVSKRNISSKNSLQMLARFIIGNISYLRMGKIRILDQEPKPISLVLPPKQQQSPSHKWHNLEPPPMLANFS